MNASATLLQCSSCCSLRIYPSLSSSVSSRRKCFRRSPLKICSVSSIRVLFREKRLVVCQATSSETQTEPESNNDKDKDEGLSPPTSSIAQNNGHVESQAAADEPQLQSVTSSIHPLQHSSDEKSDFSNQIPAAMLLTSNHPMAKSTIGDDHSRISK